MNKCYKCGSESELMVQARYSMVCRSCNTARLKRYRETDQGKAAVKKAVTKYEEKNPQRRSAWNLAQKIKLQPCEVCGATEKVHRHHDDPKKPLDVMFLCPLHHKARHRMLKAIASDLQVINA